MEETSQQCAAVVVEWLLNGTAGQWLRSLYWLGGAALGFFALLALQTRVKQGRANILFHLDSRWTEIMDSRREIDKFCREVTESVAVKHKRLDEGARKEKIREECARILAERLESGESHEFYKNVLEFWGFFEFIGLMVSQKYVPLDDVVRLFKGPILDFERIFADHIAARQKETGMPEGLLEHALWLSHKTRKRYGDN